MNSVNILLKQNTSSKKGGRHMIRKRNKKSGSDFEDFVAYVYQSLLNINNYPCIVSKHVCINGLNGPSGEIDIYYEFEHLNLTYRVAIECKDWKNPVPADEVRSFSTKINNLNNVAGVMISTSGYQSGAIDFAKRSGIILMEGKELPTFNQILAEKIKNTFLPNEKIKGEPFWTLMELMDGEVTGAYYSMPGNKGVPLLISKKTTEELRETLSDKERWGIRGISQRQLRGLLDITEKLGFKLLFCPIPLEDGKVTCIEIGHDKIRKHYLL